MDPLFRLVLPDWMLFPQSYHGFFSKTLFLIPLLPLLGFVLQALLRKNISRGASGALACLASAAAFCWALLSFLACFQRIDPASVPELGYDRFSLPLHAVYGTWIQAGDFSCSFGLYLDALASVMVLVITGVGTLIHIYSMGYMSHDPSFARYFAYLNLFLFSMLVLVMGDNLVLLFVGWEGVGLCSYLLIGFWYQDAEKAAAGMKAFVFNRIGDLGFLLGLFTLAAVFGTVNYVSGLPVKVQAQDQSEKEVWEQRLAVDPLDQEAEAELKAWPKVILPPHPGLLDFARGLEILNPQATNFLDYDAGKVDRGNFNLAPFKGASVFPNLTLGTVLTLACLLLFVGAMGKSAQLPLYAWLPDAMAGPTPVSALIHAATMVTAGVYLVARLHPLFLFSPTALEVVAFVGGTTALFGALCALTQTDIKKVLAYSTVSQLGYMFLALGVGAFSLAIFHVVTHAFFKALLFLGAGSLIHALSGEQNLLRMGGLRKHLPCTFWTMLIGALALAGFPGTAGWFSKDQILASVLAKAQAGHAPLFYALYAMALAAAFCTAFYAFRMMGLAFFGPNRSAPGLQGHLHESPPVMTIPLVVLAAFCVLGGFWWDGRLQEYLGMPLPKQDVEHVHLRNLLLAGAAALGGIFWAFRRYARQGHLPNPEASRNPLVRLSWHRFYLEAFYDRVVVGTFTLLAEFLHLVVDVLLIDFILVNGTAHLVRWVGSRLRRIQTGSINGYAAGMLIGTLTVIYFLLRG